MDLGDNFTLAGDLRTSAPWPTGRRRPMPNDAGSGQMTHGHPAGRSVVRNTARSPLVRKLLRQRHTTMAERIWPSKRTQPEPASLSISVEACSFYMITRTAISDNDPQRSMPSRAVAAFRKPRRAIVGCYVRVPGSFKIVRRLFFFLYIMVFWPSAIFCERHPPVLRGRT